MLTGSSAHAHWVECACSLSRVRMLTGSRMQSVIVLHKSIVVLVRYIPLAVNQELHK